MKTIKILFINFGKPAVRKGSPQTVRGIAVSLYRERVVVARTPTYRRSLNSPSEGFGNKLPRANRCVLHHSRTGNIQQKRIGDPYGNLRYP